MDLPKAEELKALVAALAPGLIILGIRQPFLAAPEPSLADRAIKYAAISAVYYAIVPPLLLVVQRYTGLPDWTSNALEYLVIPSALGVIAAVAVRKEWAFRAWRHFNNQPIHPVPTAWDYIFGRLKTDVYLIVTMADGSQVAGHYEGEGSFASSSNTERDLLIGEVWEIEDGKWSKPADPRSILLCGKDIKHIEFIRGTTDEQTSAVSA